MEPYRHTDASTYAKETFLAPPERERAGVALCLSGGGFRAALFHLGALRRLSELGALAHVDTVSCVSGGSILGAHLAARVLPWPKPGTQVENFEGVVAAPFRAFASKNLRTPALLSRAKPWNWFRPAAAAEALAAAYERRLTPLHLRELPERPRFVFCATDMAFGVNWISERERVGDYRVGYAAPPEAWSVGRAVAASSCFPPVFNPLPTRIPPSAFRGGSARRDQAWEALVQGLRLTDGGAYDNLGLEPVWKRHRVVLVSDGGATFDAAPDRGLFPRLMRYAALLENQVGALRRRWLIASFVTGSLEGTYWGIGSKAAHYDYVPPASYPARLVDEVIAEVRTDMDAFSEAEMAVLENHGYMLAETAVRRHVPQLVAAEAAPFQVPHPAFLDEARVRQALRGSSRRKLPFGRW